MHYLNNLVLSNDVTWETALIRLLISFIIGTVIGIEREAHNQPAGLRTHILICVGSSLVMLLSIYIPQTFISFQNGDPGRIAAQVVSGIGFLGAGAILKFGGDVKGLTTAASIWVIAAIGLVIGAGMITVGIIGTIIILFALTIMDIFEKKIFKERLMKKIEIQVKKKNTDINLFKKRFKELDIKVIAAGFERNISDATDKLTFVVGITRKTNVQMIVEELESHEGIVSVSVELIL